MVKVRMNTADVAAEVKCLRRLIGMRCANVYDISPKTYLFKLVNSSGITESGESEKVLLLMESGIRLHTTAYVRDKSTTPSGFTLKLRKHIRTRRLEDVRQLGYDRIVLFQFGLGANAHYIILELYAQGNILLTDADFMVMTLLRSHRDDEKGLTIMSRHHYPIEACRMFERTNPRKLEMALNSSQPPSTNDSSETNETIDNASKEDTSDKKNKQKRPPDPNKKAKDVGRSNKCTLKTTLGEVLGYGPALSEHMILDAGLLPNMKTGVVKDSKIDDNVLQLLMEAIARFEDWLTDIISGEKVPEGYILMQHKDTVKQGSAPSKEAIQDKVYDEVCPILLCQFKTRDFIKLETFDAALDEFYSKIESQRLKQQQMAKEGSAMQKLEKIRSDQENRVHILKKEVDHCIKMAQLIEYNLEDVDAAILAVCAALANGMDWVDLTRMVKEEKKAGNPVAGLIDKLCFEKNCITLLLSNNLDEMDEEEKTSPVDKVEVDLSLSAHANARRWYDLKKKQEFKQEKTVSAHEKAFKAAEKKTRMQLAQEKTVAAISHIRKVHWFEKFNWFITSENYLVISGRDAQQNEMIVKRYMSKGDLYIHADLHGASSTVIKNHKPENPVPPLSLNQAGCYTVCQSQAWNSKIVTSAWWVYPHQVSKTAPTGEYLTVGSFMVRGKKNFLPPHPLVMGFGILFRVDESSLALHINERRVRGEDEGLHDMIEGENLKEQTDSGSGDETSGAEGDDNSKNQTHSFSSNNDKLELDDTSIISGPNDIQFMQSGLKPVFLSENQDGNNNDTLTVDLDISSADMHETVELSISPQLENLIDRALELGPAKGLGRRHEYEAPPNVPSDTSLHTLLENPSSEERKGASRDKPYISKAERRKLKKNQNGSDAAAPSLQEKEKDDTSDVRPKKNAENLRPSVSRITRGQKGKIKKIKEKYAEQDDEERKIRMALLASAGKAAKKENILDAKDEDAPNYSKTTTRQEESSKICYKCKKPGHLSKDCQEHRDEVDHIRTTANEENREADLLPTIDRDRVTIEEDDVHDIAEEEREKLNDLDFLTGNPLPNDILLYAIPVCGPYNALQAYKYRVKITPGTAKKGKAAKTALGLFSHMSEATNREKELLKACTDSELVAAIIGNAKITAPGLTQLKQRQKKGKKSEKGK